MLSASTRRAGESGAIALISALLAVTLLVVAAFAVDIGNTWARRGQLQVQADRAALLAAEQLPVVDAATKVAAARTVAGYLACHPVAGQRQLDPDIPQCPDPDDEASSTAITDFAQRLLTDDLVTFPTPTRVSVRTPAARVDYSFGRVAGAAGSTQVKTATAQVSSPGDVLPVALSLTCVAASVGTAPLGLGDALSDIVPVNYVSSGSGDASDDLLDLDRFLACARPFTSPRTDGGAPDADLTEQEGDLVANLRTGLDHPLGTHPDLLTLVDGLGVDLGSPLTGTFGYFRDLTSASGQLNPMLVFSCDDAGASNRFDATTDPPDPTLRPNCLRVDTAHSWAEAFTRGFLTGEGRLSCAVHDCEHGSVQVPGIPGDYNDDEFYADFVTDQDSLLTDPLFFGLDTFVMPELPLVTPSDAVDPALYESPRFFWLPVVTTAYLNNTTEDYPVLSFRPVFITQERPESAVADQIVDGLVLDLVAKAESEGGGLLGWLDVDLGDLLTAVGVGEGLEDVLHTLGGGNEKEVSGLVVDPEEHQLKAVRFTTIAPGALPVIGPDYDGPTTEYLGMGPRVIRLVR